MRGVLQGDILSLSCFIIALDRIFRDHNLPDACIVVSETLKYDKFESADDVGLLDEKAAAALEPLTILSFTAESEDSWVVAAQISFGKNVQAHERR